MSKWKFDAAGRKVLRTLSQRIQELDAHLASFTESSLADAKNVQHTEESVTGMPPDAARDQLNQAARALSHVITKVSIVWKDAVPLKELEETAESVESALTTLLQVYKALVALNVATGVWGEMVVIPLQKALQGIIFDVGTLVTQFYSLKRTKQTKKQTGEATREKEGDGASAHLTGLVWEGCKTLESIPLDNVRAVMLQLKKWKETVEDAMNEMKDLVEEQKEKAGEEKEKIRNDTEGEKEPTKKKKGDDDDEDSDFDDSDEEEEWTKEESAVLPGVLLLIRCSFGLLNGLSSLLEKNVTITHTKPADAHRQCLWLRELLTFASVLTKHVDEMGVCVYPPQKKDVILQNYANLARHIEDMLAHVNTNEELRENPRCAKMGEVVHMMLGNAETQLLPLLKQ